MNLCDTLLHAHKNGNKMIDMMVKERFFQSAVLYRVMTVELYLYFCDKCPVSRALVFHEQVRFLYHTVEFSHHMTQDSYQIMILLCSSHLKQSYDFSHFITYLFFLWAVIMLVLTSGSKDISCINDGKPWSSELHSQGGFKWPANVCW